MTHRQCVCPRLALLILAVFGTFERLCAECDLAVINAIVITIDADNPRAEAIAVAGDRITLVGTNDQVRELIEDHTQVIDAAGMTITPGFNDAHIHPSPIYPPQSPLAAVDCTPEATPTIDDLVAALRAKAEFVQKGQWVRGSRYQETKLGRHPTRHDLDRASRDHPIRISHSSGHLSVFNSYALELAGISQETPDPEGGRFDRDENGIPNGICRESAASFVRNAGPPSPRASTDEQVQGLLRRFEQYVSRGITSVQDAGSNSMSKFRLYEKAQVAGQPVRVYLMMSRFEIDDLVKRRGKQGLGDNRLKLGGIKRFHGNSLSGQTCWLYEPYADRPDYFGIPPRRSQEYLDRRILQIHNAGLQACVHSNGDREIDMVLTAIERALETAPRANHRHRLEHASIVNDEILRQVKKLGVVLAPHSYIHEHGDKMEAYGANRWDMMHPNGSAVAMEIPVAGTSDAPVSAADPLLRIQSMVTRRSAEGKVYGAKQRVTPEQAIRIWTLGSAYASFDENIKGSLTPGKLADFTMLSADPTNVPPNSIKDIEVLLTVIGGEVVYDAF